MKEELEKRDLNFDNNFSIRFTMENAKNLVHIPNNIYEIDMPDINTEDVNGDEMERYISIVLRSKKDGDVEREVYDVLCRSNFDIELSLSNPNKVDYVYKSCSVAKLKFAPLMKKQSAKPFNFTVVIKVTQIVYNGASEVFAFGNDVVPISYETEDEVLNDDK